MTKIENFDDLFVGDPSEIEMNLKNLLLKAKDYKNQSICLQIKSQIALAQAMQKKFDQAHNTLNEAEASLTSNDHLARVRILLERGRVYHQSGNTETALTYFEKSYELSKKNHFDFHTINAAHMIPMVIQNTEEKIKWNLIAIDIATNTQDTRAKTWLGPLYNNLAQNYIEYHQYHQAYDSFNQCLQLAETQGNDLVARGAKWGIARSLRSLGDLDKALSIHLSLLEEFQNIEQNKLLPKELIFVSRGMVYEELTEIHLAFTKKFANLAYQDLHQDEWFKKLEFKRLEKLRVLSR